MTETDPARQVLHATCVAVGDRGLLVLGASGSGKSSLALRLIALGAVLISDDQVLLQPDGDADLRASCPSPAILGLIEARGFGLLRLPVQDSARIVLALDLDQAEPARLPPQRSVTLLGRTVPLAHRPQGDHLDAALYCHLAGAARELG